MVEVGRIRGVDKESVWQMLLSFAVTNFQRCCSSHFIDLSVCFPALLCISFLPCQFCFA